MMPILAPRIPERFVFTVATGRCGTAYLSQLLCSCSNAMIQHEHEPRPSFLLERLNRGEPFEEYALAWAAVKTLDAHRSLGRQFDSITIWGDASHVWCKSCLHPDHPYLLEALGVDDFRCIWLVRPPRPTVESLLRYGGFPSLFPSGLHFSMTPDHPWAVVPWPTWEAVHGDHGEPIEQHRPGRAALALWYWREIQRIGARAVEVWGDRVLRVDLETLNTRFGVQKVHRHCGIEPVESSIAVHFQHRINSSESHGTEPIRLTDAEWAEAVAMVDEVEREADAE